MILKKAGCLKLIGIILFIIILIKIDWRQVEVIIKQLNYLWLLASIVFGFLFIFIKTLRWKYLLYLQGINYRFPHIFYVYLSGTFWGLITPGRIGEFIKLGYVRRDLGLNYGMGASSIIIDRLTDVLLSIIVTIVGIAGYAIPMNKIAVWALIITGAAFFILVIFLVKGKRGINRLVRGFLKDKGNAQMEDFFTGIDRFKDVRIIIPVIFSAIAFYTCIGYSYLLTRALHIEISYFYLSFCMGLVNLIMLIPITISGIGTREASLIFLFGLVGLNQEAAITFSLMSFAVFTVFCGIWCLSVWLRYPLIFQIERGVNQCTS